MNNKEYKTLYKEIDLFVYFLTLIIVAILLRTKIIIYSENVTKSIALVFVLAAYYVLLVIAKKLKKYGIDGVSYIAWASLWLYFISSIEAFSNNETSLLWTIVFFVSMIGYLRFAIDGFIRLFLSVVRLINNKKESNYPASVEGAIAVFTSLIAILVTLLELLL